MRTEIDRNECEHFLKAELDRSKIDGPELHGSLVTEYRCCYKKKNNVVYFDI